MGVSVLRLAALDEPLGFAVTRSFSLLEKSLTCIASTGAACALYSAQRSHSAKRSQSPCSSLLRPPHQSIRESARRQRPRRRFTRIHRRNVREGSLTRALVLRHVWLSHRPALLPSPQMVGLSRPHNNGGWAKTREGRAWDGKRNSSLGS